MESSSVLVRVIFTIMHHSIISTSRCLHGLPQFLKDGCNPSSGLNTIPSNDETDHWSIRTSGCNPPSVLCASRTHLNLNCTKFLVQLQSCTRAFHKFATSDA